MNEPKASEYASGRMSRRRMSPRFLGVKKVDRRRVYLSVITPYESPIIAINKFNNINGTERTNEPKANESAIPED